LIKEYEKFPTLGGLAFNDHRLGRRTWFREHAAAYGIQIYQKRRKASEKEHRILSES